ncbi:MAG: hypothetical protein HYR94_16740 [Chloroflexi bacterium]|nr:hypothetical protein [Chloroflexota bacterium]
MKHLVGYVALWFMAGYTLGGLARQFTELPLSGLECGLLGLTAGLIGLVPMIQTEQGRRLFYEGPAPGEEGDLLIGCLWLMGAQILLLALSGWGVWLIVYLSGIPIR